MKSEKQRLTVKADVKMPEFKDVDPAGLWTKDEVAKRYYQRGYAEAGIQVAEKLMKIMFGR